LILPHTAHSEYVKPAFTESFSFWFENSRTSVYRTPLYRNFLYIELLANLIVHYIEKLFPYIEKTSIYRRFFKTNLDNFFHFRALSHYEKWKLGEKGSQWRSLRTQKNQLMIEGGRKVIVSFCNSPTSFKISVVNCSQTSFSLFFCLMVVPHF